MKRMIRGLVLVIVLLIVWFVCYLSGMQRDYSSGIKAVTAGEYEEACEIFTGLDGYRDSEILAEYCAVMAEYDAYDYASVFRSYYDLKELDIDNEYLEVEVAAKRAEIAALYIHCASAQ